MFLRDKELRRAGGTDDQRARVLQKAKEQREARSQQKEKDAFARKLQAFLRGRVASKRARTAVRSDLDQKMGDIAKLKLILQNPSMALPYDALFDVCVCVCTVLWKWRHPLVLRTTFSMCSYVEQLLRKLLFSYRDVPLDYERLLQLSLLFADALSANAEGLTSCVADAQRQWMLQRLLDLCVQSQSVSTTASSAPLYNVVLRFADASPELRRYLLSGRLTAMEPSNGMLFCDLEKSSLTRLVRRFLVRSRGPQQSTAIPAARKTRCTELMDVTVHFLRNSSEILESFINEVGVGILADCFEWMRSAHLHPNVVCLSLCRCFRSHCCTRSLVLTTCFSWLSLVYGNESLLLAHRCHFQHCHPRLSSGSHRLPGCLAMYYGSQKGKSQLNGLVPIIPIES